MKLDDKVMAMSANSAPWHVGPECTFGIPIYDAEDCHFATIGRPLSESDYATARLIAAAPVMYEAIQLDAAADKLERDDPEQSKSTIAMFRDHARVKRAEILAAIGVTK